MNLWVLFLPFSERISTHLNAFLGGDFIKSHTGRKFGFEWNSDFSAWKFVTSPMQQSQVFLHWVVSLLLSKELVGRSWLGRGITASAHLELEFNGDVALLFHGNGLERRAVRVLAEVRPLQLLLVAPSHPK